MPFSFRSLSIPDVTLVQTKSFSDDRGYFIESFKSSDFIANCLPGCFVQDNFSFSKKNVLRGLHFQKNPKEQGKLIFVIKGSVWDVAVDIRKNSPTFSKWIAVELTDKKHEMLYIPAGFAHGFLSLTEDVYLIYKCTKEYDPMLDSGIRWDDPDIGIKWPIDNPVVSMKDKNLAYLKYAGI